MKIDKQTTKDEQKDLQRELYVALVGRVIYEKDLRRPETIYKECRKNAIEAARSYYMNEK